MPPGAGMTIAFDPPGAIGLPIDDSLVLLRFDEPETAVPPKDAVGNLSDLARRTGPGMTTPASVDAVLGRGRAFDPGSATGLEATDLVSGSTLATRDCSIQVVLSWSITGQNVAGNPGTVVARGTGGSVAQYTSYAVQLAVVDPPSFTGQIRWLWQDVAGVVKTQTGAQFSLAGGFTMLTATRRWVSPTEVTLKYYIGNVLLGEVTSSDGSIGGGTTGTFQVGHRNTGNILAGTIDELRVVDYEMSLEEIEASWLRITQYQPLGYQLFRELHDPGFPISTNPASDVQLDTRLIGMTLGYAAAQAENLRANFLPQRAYGSTLSQWEELVRVTTAPAGSIDDRRQRVLARLRQRRGSSIPGLEDVLQGLLGGGTVDDLEFLAFTNDVADDFTTLNALRWDFDPSSWLSSSGTLQVLPPAISGNYTLDNNNSNWLTCGHAIGGGGKQAHMLGKVVFTTPVTNSEVGIYFADPGNHNYFVLGLRDVAGAFTIVTEAFTNHVSHGLITLATLGGNPAAIWFHLFQTTVDGIWTAAWSTTGPTSGFTEVTGLSVQDPQNMAGFYLRSLGSIGQPSANFDDSLSRAPFGGRPFNAYVLLDETLGFDPDIDGAHSVIQAIKHAYIVGTFIINRSVLCDAPLGCDRGPMGAI